MPRPICARSLPPPLRCIRAALRGSPIEAVVLTGAEIDQTAGLLNLRERQPFTLARDRSRRLAHSPAIRCSARLALTS